VLFGASHIADVLKSNVSDVSLGEVSIVNGGDFLFLFVFGASQMGDDFNSEISSGDKECS